MKIVIVFVGALFVLNSSTLLAALFGMHLVPKVERREVRRRLLGEGLQWFAIAVLFLGALFYSYPPKRASFLLLIAMAVSLILGIFWLRYVKRRLREVSGSDREPFV